MATKPGSRSFLPHLVRIRNRTRFGRRVTPPFVTLYVTTRCDEHCLHCYYWDELNPKPNVDFTLDEFERTLASMGEIFNLFIGGGEPFLRADLADIILAAHARNRVANVYVPTNGQHTVRVEETLDRVLRAAPGLRFHLNLSVDHVDEAEHDRIRGRDGAYRRLLRTAGAVETLRAAHPNLILHTLTTVMKDNQADILRIHDEIAKRFRPDGRSYNFCRGNPLDPGQTEVDPRVYRSLARRLEQERRGGSVPGGGLGVVSHSLDEQVRSSVERTVVQQRAQFSCVAGRLACVIYSNGEVTECETKNSVLGNLRECAYDFPSLWFGNRAEQVAEEAASGCFCTHECGHYASTIYGARGLVQVAARAAGSTLRNALRGGRTSVGSGHGRSPRKDRRGH